MQSPVTFNDLALLDVRSPFSASPYFFPFPAFFFNLFQDPYGTHTLPLPFPHFLPSQLQHSKTRTRGPDNTGTTNCQSRCVCSDAACTSRCPCRSEGDIESEEAADVQDVNSLLEEVGEL